jgi:hypothetical protein
MHVHVSHHHGVVPLLQLQIQEIVREIIVPQYQEVVREAVSVLQIQ